MLAFLFPKRRPMSIVEHKRDALSQLAPTKQKTTLKGLFFVLFRYAINDWDISNVESGKFKDMFSNTPTHPNFTIIQGTWNEGTFTPNQN